MPGATKELAIDYDILWQRFGTKFSSIPDSAWQSLPHFHSLPLFVSSPSPVQTTPTALSSTPSPAIEPWLLYQPSQIDTLADQYPYGGGAGGSAAAGQPPPTRPLQRHLLFQYKPYCQQDPLHLPEQDIESIIEAAFGTLPLSSTLPPPSTTTTSTTAQHQHQRLDTSAASSDIACVVLIKLILDMYLRQSPEIACTIIRHILSRALLHAPTPVAKCRVFDFIINVAVHGEMLYEVPGGGCDNDTQFPENDVAVERDGPSSLEDGGGRTQRAPGGAALTNNDKQTKFHRWIVDVFYRMLSLLCVHVRGMSREQHEREGYGVVWASAVATLAALITTGSRGRDGGDKGGVLQSAVEGFPMEAASRMLVQAREQAWPVSLRYWLGGLTATLLLENSKQLRPSAKSMHEDSMAAFGGIDRVVEEYLSAPTIQCQRAFFCVLFEHVLNVNTDLNIELLSRLHSAQVDALGAAFLHCRVPESLPVVATEMVLSPSSAVLRPRCNEVARFVFEQVTSVQSKYPEIMPVVPPVEAIALCIEALTERMLAVMTTTGSVRATHTEAQAMHVGTPGASFGRRNVELTNAMIAVANQRILHTKEARGSCLLPLPSERAKEGEEEGRLSLLLHELFSFSSPPQHQKIQDGSSSSSTRRLDSIEYIDVFMQAMCAMLDHVYLQHHQQQDEYNRKESPTGMDASALTKITLETLRGAMEWVALTPGGPRQRGAAAIAEYAVAIVSDRMLDPWGMDAASNSGGNSGEVSGKSITAATTTATATKTTPGKQQSMHERIPPATVDSGLVPAPVQPTEPTPALVAMPSTPVGAAATTTTNRPVSPLNKLMPPVPKLSAAWRRLTGPHGGGSSSGGSGAGRQVPGAGGGRGSPDMPPVQPLSAGLSALDASQSGERAPSHPQQRQQPQQPQQLNRSGAHRSLRSLAAQKTLLDREQRREFARNMAATIATVEAKVTAIESLLLGVSQPNLKKLNIAPSALFMSILEAISPPLPPLWLYSHSLPQRLSALQIGRPLWDSRAAAAILLLTRLQVVPDAAKIESSMLAMLLTDADPRIRRQASRYTLSQFAHHHPQHYRAAMRDVVAKAQRGNNERLLMVPEVTVAVLLEQRVLSLGMLSSHDARVAV